MVKKWKESDKNIARYLGESSPSSCPQISSHTATSNKGQDTGDSGGLESAPPCSVESSMPVESAPRGTGVTFTLSCGEVEGRKERL